MKYLDKTVKIFTNFISGLFGLAGLLLLIPGAIGFGLIWIGLHISMKVEGW